MSQYQRRRETAAFEAVIDVATGVGKTYILAGAIDLFSAAYGVSNFVIITPGRTILEDTRQLHPVIPNAYSGR